MVRQRVQYCVGRGVVRLSRPSHQGCDRGEEDEGVEPAVGGELVQVPGAGDLRGEDPGETPGILLFEGGVVQHTGGVPDAGERRQLGIDSAQHTDEVIPRCHVALNHLDPRAARPDPLDRRGCLDGRLRASHERHGSRSPRGEPAGKSKPHSPEPTRHQLSAAAADDDALAHGAHCRHLRKAQGHLANVPSLSHVSEGVDRLGAIEDPARQRLEVPASGVHHDPRKPGSHATGFRVAHFTEVHDVVADVRAPPRRLLDAPDVAPPQLEEAAALRRHGEAALDEVAGK